MVQKWKIDLEFVEQGDIYFFYKPKKGVEKVEGLSDVSRFFFVLDPADTNRARYIVMGNKRMPSVNDGGDTTWGFVQMVGGRGFATERNIPVPPRKGASRPAGEGIYAIVKHRDHSHLLYSLELPQRIGEVQKAFSIQKEANYIFLHRPVRVRPSSPSAPFSNYSTVSVTENLNHRGTQLLLVGVGADVGRLGVRAERESETFHTADIFSKLKVDKDRHPSHSLLSGKWE